jgi:hypothetical protein
MDNVQIHNICKNITVWDIMQCSRVESTGLNGVTYQKTVLFEVYICWRVVVFGLQSNALLEQYN